MWDVPMDVQYLHGQSGIRGLREDAGKMSKFDGPGSERVASW